MYTSTIFVNVTLFAYFQCLFDAIRKLPIDPPNFHKVTELPRTFCHTGTYSIPMRKKISKKIYRLIQNYLQGLYNKHKVAGA